MKGNQKHLHSQDLKEYYNCLEIIDNENNLLSSAIDDLSWCESKLQEAQKLVKSFGLTNQSINSPPEINFYATKINRIRVENILTTIKENREKLTENEKLINDLVVRQDVNHRDISTVSSKIKELEDKKYNSNSDEVATIVGEVATIVVLVVMSVFVVGMFAVSPIIGFAIIILFFFFVGNSMIRDIQNKEKIRELEAQINNSKSIINKLKIKSNQLQAERKSIENNILKLLSELNEWNKLVHRIKEDNEDKLEKEFNEKSAKINQIITRICISGYPDNPPRLLNLNWSDPLWIPSENDPFHWQPQINSLAPDIVRIGEIELNYKDNFFRFPVLVPIRDFSKQLQGGKSGHIAFYSQDANSRQTVLLALQSVAFRMISTFPVRKFKGIFIDPVGMGDTFPFGNLHEFITNQKTYTRADDIREQLRGLTEHIEQVIQNYLGSNYSTIEDYNLDAGAISEPYRYLFIADFPTGFDQRTLEDLKSILLNGPKTGVYVILHIDKNLEKPRNFDYQTFNDFCTIIDKFTNNSRYQIYFPNVSQPLFLTLDQPPANQLFNEMAEAINQAIRNVKVDTIAFAKLYPDHNWFADSGKEIRTPIGLMGAKDKLEFWFGENEDGNIVSNGLLAGKPGAGKSFTLHAIILSLAMQYSPDELELYLLDFKQGVEFQIYVDAEKGENRDFSSELDETRALPHAKVISIESDREFGLSVLEYVNQQIEERSKLFKSAGNLEKIYEYRNATGKKLPRILVLIDEFQYMFQESDAIAQRLNVVMENIVRQGRAFGIHLLIASQSPNVSNMNRKIYDFLDLRMALQMPQNTAGYVLDESNTDAIDLLDRPGKMIYNSNFGNKNYNDIGQVADISAEERHKALIHIQKVAKDRQYQRPEPLVLFYGSKPTQLKDNRQLLQLMKMNQWLSLRELNKQIIKDPDWIVPESPAVFWLGEPMRIGNHTQGIFRRRPRSNLLLVGNSEETIFGIIGGILMSLIHCCQPQKASFNIIDLSIEDEDNYWTEMTVNFRDIFKEFFPIKIAKKYADKEQQIIKAETLLKETFEEFERRLKLRDENPELNPDELGESLFFIYAIGGINKASNLRPVMGRREEEPSEDAQKILELISKGSELGIHTILWLEDMKGFAKLSNNNRQWLGNFDLRVGLTMSGDNSRLLLGESFAEKLPRLRAYFKDDSLSVDLDKFKPYAVPSKTEMLEYENNFKQRF